MTYKHVIIVTDAWSPQVNGVIVSLERMRESLEREGTKVTVIQPNMFFTIPLFFYPEILLAIPTARLKKLLLKDKPDCIHIATEGPLGISARMICTRNKIKFTTSYHTNFQQYMEVRLGKWISGIVQYCLKWFHSKSEATMVCTPTMKDSLQKKGFKNVVLWPLGVDPEFFVRNENAKGKSLNLPKPIFVYFGRIAKEKNVEEFLKCELPGSKLIVGDGPDRASLEKKYPNTIFLGYKHGKALVDTLSQCDVFVFPSRTETFGLVVVEALSCGIPVAAHDTLGPKDIITPGVDGQLSEDLSCAAKECLKLSRASCRKKALTFSWDKSFHSFKNNLVKIDHPSTKK
ncbi:MAG: glycosyltransferase family 1 protein [Candidatus Pacebacteria bacterium]|nr:glycosyltransferase family 1 protein [Candidatus Paceibacterota bacterium]